MHPHIQPIVLVGGRSRRFGRDKLREPLQNGDGQWLVDRPIAVLRAVFGPRVALVGDCHPDVAARGDLVIEDSYPGAGPIGGILSALETVCGDIFVLSGDLPAVTADVVQAIVTGAERRMQAWAVLARSRTKGAEGLLEPCIGVYRQPAAALASRSLAGGRRSLHDLVPAQHLATVDVDAASTANINTHSAMLSYRDRCSTHMQG